MCRYTLVVSETTSATHSAAAAEIGARERGALAHGCRRCGQDDCLAAPTARRARSAGILRGIIGNDAVFRHVGHCGIAHRDGHRPYLGIYCRNVDYLSHISLSSLRISRSCSRPRSGRAAQSPRRGRRSAATLRPPLRFPQRRSSPREPDRGIRCSSAAGCPCW